MPCLVRASTRHRFGVGHSSVGCVVVGGTIREARTPQTLDARSDDARRSENPDPGI